MKKAKIYIITLLGVFVLSCEKTSTPSKFLNDNKIDRAEYEIDKKILSQLVMLRRDSLRSSSPTPEGKSLQVYIDTILYGPDGKIVFLSITKKENQFTMNKDKISYYGESYIGLKETTSDGKKITDRLKYGSSSDETDGLKRVQKSLRNIYLQEMEYIDGRYNINDNRFWTSSVW